MSDGRRPSPAACVSKDEKDLAQVDAHGPATVRATGTNHSGTPGTTAATAGRQECYVMDLQTVINFGLGAVLTVCGWFARQMWAAVSELRRDLSDLREELPKTYATKGDFKDGIHELKQLLIAIDRKLDHKADK